MAEVSNSKLLNIDAGILNVQDACIVLVRTEWNAGIVDELEAGAIRELEKHGVARVITITVPGAFEIPFAIKNFDDFHNAGRVEKDVHAFIALATVIRGDTPHFDYVCKAITDGVVQLNLTLTVPVIFGVLTVDNEQQARERIGGKHGHKGEEAAITALKMISLSRNISRGR